MGRRSRDAQGLEDLSECAHEGEDESGQGGQSSAAAAGRHGLGPGLGPGLGLGPSPGLGTGLVLFLGLSYHYSTSILPYPNPLLTLPSSVIYCCSLGQGSNQGVEETVFTAYGQPSAARRHRLEKGQSMEKTHTLELNLLNQLFSSSSFSSPLSSSSLITNRCWSAGIPPCNVL